MKKKFTSAEELDKYFDDGGSIILCVDLPKAVRLNNETQRFNIDFPATILRSLDHEATRIGVARQVLIKMWIAEKLKECS